MAGNAPSRAQYTVACGCGVNMTLDARGFGKPRACRSCGATVTVAWGRDPNSRKTVPVAMTQKKAVPKAPAAPSASPGPTQTQDLLKALCACGNSKRIPAAQRNKPPLCMCGRTMRVEDVPIDRPKGKIEKFERAKPSAPLLPLHLRAPLRVRIKRGAQFFDCVCGERVLIRNTVSDGRPIQCPACERFHTLELDVPPPPGPAPVPGAAPRGAMPPPSRPLTLGEFLCQCGEIQPPRTSRTGKTFECKKCGRKGHVEADKDPQTGLPKMRPIFTSGPKAPPAAAAGSAAAPPPPPSGAPAWTCTCGRTIEAAVAMSRSDASCPGCGRPIKLEKWKHPHSSMTMIRPVFGEPPAAPGKKAPPPAEGVVTFEELSPFDPSAGQAEAAIFETAAGSDGGDAPPVVESDAQIVPCDCGAELLLSTNDVGATIQCPACGDMMSVEERGGKFALRLIGGLETTDWKLEEFQ